MKIQAIIAAVCLTGCVAAAVPASADKPPAPIKTRLKKQAHRIRWGVRHGEISRGEAKDLWAAQRRMRGNWGRTRSGGRSRRERSDLQRRLDYNSHKIYRKNHNNRWR